MEKEGKGIIATESQSNIVEITQGIQHLVGLRCDFEVRDLQ